MKTKIIIVLITLGIVSLSPIVIRTNLFNCRKFLLFNEGRSCLISEHSQDDIREEDKIVAFHLVCEKTIPDCLELPLHGKGEVLCLEKAPVLTLADIALGEYKTYEPSEESKKIAEKLGVFIPTERLHLVFTEQGKDKLLNITSNNINRRLGLIMEGELLIAPIIKEPISGGKLQIAGELTPEEMKAIAQRINELKGVE